MKSIHKWLEEDAGIKLGITSLTSYISRIRRCPKGRSGKEKSEPAHSPPPPSWRRPLPPPPAETTTDPLAQAMNALSKRPLDIREIHNDGGPDGKKLI